MTIDRPAVSCLLFRCALRFSLACAVAVAAGGCIAVGFPGPGGTGPEPEPEPKPEPEPQPEPCEAMLPYWVTMDVVDSGLGIESVTANLHYGLCSGESLYVANDCCYGPATHLQYHNPDGSYVDVPPDVVCECGGPTDPLVVLAGTTLSFSALPYGGWQYGGGQFRWIFTVSECADMSCPVELPSPDFEFYWEG
ncbi:MAG TPA: hypothetical protein VG389_04865 [Myxococcota bacterium]|jgi:hypothetical protein|nr:hypothetical protein [Myxococcota bacterium]